jgi:HK97 family phage portal protein
MINLRSAVEWLKTFGNHDSGKIHVTGETMLGSAAIWYAICTISGDVAKMPFEPRKTKPDGRGSNPMRENAAWRLLRDESNGYQTPDVFKEQIMSHALGWGNGRAYIGRVGNRPVELIPMLPDRTHTMMIMGQKYHCIIPDIDDPLLFYEQLGQDIQGGQQGRVMVIPDRDVLHIMGFSYDGIEGRSLAKVAKDSIAIDLQAQRFGKRQMEKGLASKVMIEDTADFFQDEDDAKKFIENFRKSYSNEQDGNVAGLLRNGMKASVLQMSNTDAQFIESRKFSRQEVMLWFGLQHIPGDSSSVSYNSLEQKQLAYLASCLDRWLVRWEMQCDMKLRTEAEKVRGDVYFKFNPATLLRTDTAATASVLTLYVQAKIMTRNEAREKLDMNPVEGGDVFENPMIQVSEPAAAADAKPSVQPQNKAIQTRIQHIVGVQANQVRVAAGKQKNFIAWAEMNHENWQVKLKSICAELEIDSAIVLADSDLRLDELMTACECQPGELVATVEALTEAWKFKDWSY